MLKRAALASTTFIVACAVEALSLSGATQTSTRTASMRRSISVVLQVAHFRPTSSRSRT